MHGVEICTNIRHFVGGHPHKCGGLLTRIKNPRDFTVRLLIDIKNNVIQINS